MSQDETQSDQEAEEKLQINLRVSRRQREKWQRLADADDRPLAAWIRRQVEKQINADETGSGGTP
jgi:hypothetical protein